jgi:hypothetical protein
MERRSVGVIYRSDREAPASASDRCPLCAGLFLRGCAARVPSVVTRPNRLAVVGYVILALAIGYAIFLNRADIDKVCATVQRQLDRNEATLQRSLDGQRLIQSNPVMARRKNVPGADYYADRPMELRAQIARTQRELHTYEGNAC